MELIFGIVALYPVFLAALHVPMWVAYFALKRLGLLRPWHFVLTCSAVFGLGHSLAAALLFERWPGYVAPAVGMALGVVCGLTWWYILVRRLGVDGPSQRRVSAA